MKTSVQLDYQAILANSAQPVHLAFQFTAPTLSGHRERPIAFSLVLDRSGSMEGAPLEAARRAAKTVVQNLRRGDNFSLVTYDETAAVAIPMGPMMNKQEAYDKIDRIQPGGATNLAGGWMLGRDGLRGTPVGTVRRQLLLTDGLLNRGITETPLVRQVVTDGLERDGIRTSTLGFGDQYNEDLLGVLASATGGSFYDANQADQLPEIFKSELDGLQNIAVQNLRLRFKSLGFVDGLLSLGGYIPVELPDGRLEFPVGDLTADEDRVAVFVLSVLPIPLIAGGTTPETSLEGEALSEVEIAYDEITPAGVTTHSECHTIRVRPTQSPRDIQINKDVLPWVSAQQAAEALGKAIALRDTGDLAGAKLLITAAIARLKAYASDAQIADGLKLLENALQKLENPDDYRRARKSIQCSTVSYSRMSSSEHWASVDEAPSFKKPRRPAPPETNSPETNPGQPQP
jgi:Ca-activated chloride channel family protein